jgi:hypothetical protein
MDSQEEKQNTTDYGLMYAEKDITYMVQKLHTATMK